MIDRLPEDAQTIYAEALAVLLADEAERSFSHLSGTFTSKTVKGIEYLYFQYSDPGGTRRQFAIGRRDAALDARLADHAARRREREPVLAQIARLAGLLRSAGVALVPHAPARVLRALADAGLFRIGAVLMGSYAFQILGNLLGVRWPGAAWRTGDVDIAGHLQVALPTSTADVPKTLEALEMGFVPVPQLDVRAASTSFVVRGQSLRLDLITPGREGQDAPIFIPRFNAAAAPIKYLSIAMHEAQPALAVNGSAAMLVVVPSPARYALHKLLVSQTRSAMQQTKSGKDLHQAALLLEVLAEDRPDDLESAAAAFSQSGPAVAKKILRALALATKRWPIAEAGAAIVRARLAE